MTDRQGIQFGSRQVSTKGTVSHGLHISHDASVCVGSRMRQEASPDVAKKKKRPEGTSTPFFLCRRHRGKLEAFNWKQEAITLTKRYIKDTESEKQTYFTLSSSSKSSGGRTNNSPCWSQGSLTGTVYTLRATHTYTECGAIFRHNPLPGQQLSNSNNCVVACGTCEEQGMGKQHAHTHRNTQ